MDQALKDRVFNQIEVEEAVEFCQNILRIPSFKTEEIEVEQYYPELGHGQQELTLRFADALRAADNHIICRETMRNVAWQHGFYASFAPKPFADQAGNGCHIHFSA